MRSVRGVPIAIFLALLSTAPASADAPRRAGRALMTFYWIIDESAPRYRGKRDDAVLRNMHGEVVAHTSPRFKRDLAIEGTGWLRDGRTVMFEKRVGGESRFRITHEKYGLAATGCPLVPYRTIAVDPRFVKIGSTLYIPQLKGTHLPDGTVHDGMFVATDHGHFRGRHIDVFTGAGPRASRPFARRGYGSRSHVTVYVIEESKSRCDG
ncbi:MAG TPA: 3D domain-containing protein [Thermoanaerobaculia bacterium]